jgi:hypothetical protein
MKIVYLQTLVSRAQGLDQGVRGSPVVSEDTMVNCIKGIGIPSDDILEIRKEESPIDYTLWAPYSDYSMDNHGIV